MPPHPRIRLDQHLVRHGLAPSRARAQGLILAGKVRVDGEVITKAGTMVGAASQVEVQRDPNPYVSRGGLKLAAAIRAFSIEVQGKVALDIGASTGGFTDCLLQHGAQRVYAVDVGYGQLHWNLRQDPRVIVLERTNARHLRREDIPEPCSLAVLDMSFISLSKVMPAVLPLLVQDAQILALVKPQFEAEPEEVQKGGVVRQPNLRQAVVDRAVARLVSQGLVEKARMDSPVIGPKGNVECLVWFAKAIVEEPGSERSDDPESGFADGSQTPNR